MDVEDFQKGKAWDGKERQSTWWVFRQKGHPHAFGPQRQKILAKKRTKKRGGYKGWVTGVAVQKVFTPETPPSEGGGGLMKKKPRTGKDTHGHQKHISLTLKP